MQAFGRPVAQAFLSQTRLGFRAPGNSSTVLGRVRAFQQSRARLRCQPGVTTFSWRAFSTQPPKGEEPKNESQPKVEETNQEPTRNPELDAQPEPQGKENSGPVSDLPSALERRRSELNQKFSQIMDNVQSRVLTASKTLNEVTGYSSIEDIKLENAALETALADAKARVRSARQAYKTSNTKRGATQREVTTLLARKESWSPVDLERFTELYRIDHTLEGEVMSSQESLTEAEAEEQSLSQRLNAGILKRYHEEQIWSDRIRRASTWGTWGLMGMNFLLFVILQFFAEPWKRRRLVKGVVAEEKAVLEEVRSELVAVKTALQRQQELAEEKVVAEQQDKMTEEIRETGAVEPPAAPAKIHSEHSANPAFSLDAWKEFLLDPARWRPAFEDLFSERRLDFRMIDASTLALEGALAGAAFAGSVAWFIVHRS